MSLRLLHIDVIVTAAFLFALYCIAAPWWMYLAAIAFGTVQRIIGVEQQKSEKP